MIRPVKLLVQIPVSTYGKSTNDPFQKNKIKETILIFELLPVHRHISTYVNIFFHIMYRHHFHMNQGIQKQNDSPHYSYAQ